MFQSVERQDQVLFTLLGGMVRHLGRHCRMLDSPSPCGCSAPASMLGHNHTVVEMGANDGLHLSNSYFFSKTLGWRTLLIEANPEVYARIAEHRPESIRINALVGNPGDFPPDGRASFYSFYRSDQTQKRGGGLDWETGLSGIAAPNGSNTVLTSTVAATRAAARYGVNFREHKLNVVPFSKLLRQNGVDHIDVLFLDVEGSEHSVLQTLNFRKTHVRALVVERPSAATVHLLRWHGFSDLKLTFDSGGDRIFLKS